MFIPCMAFSEDDFLLHGSSLEDLSKQLGNPIEVITWRNTRGALRIKPAVKGGNYQRRYSVENGLAVFEDRAEMSGRWQQWYQTGANELDKGEKLETLLEQIWGSWESGITLYHENIDKTMVIKFHQSAENGFAFSKDGYLYLHGYWYFVDGKV
jgi:hypothetical protein